MKIYNLFRPHIIQYGDKFYIRRLTLNGYRYMLAAKWYRTLYNESGFNSQCSAEEHYAAVCNPRFVKYL